MQGKCIAWSSLWSAPAGSTWTHLVTGRSASRQYSVCSVWCSRESGQWSSTNSRMHRGDHVVRFSDTTHACTYCAVARITSGKISLDWQGWHSSWTAPSCQSYIVSRLPLEFERTVNRNADKSPLVCFPGMLHVIHPQQEPLLAFSWPYILVDGGPDHDAASEMNTIWLHP